MRSSGSQPKNADALQALVRSRMMISCSAWSTQIGSLPQEQVQALLSSDAGAALALMSAGMQARRGDPAQ